MTVELNPPKKRKKRAAKKAPKKKVARKKKRRSSLSGRVCRPKSEWRATKSLKRLKRRSLRKPKNVICIPKSAIARAKHLKRLKSKYAGVKYGYARRKKKAAKPFQLVIPKTTAPQKAKRKVKTPKGVSYKYMDIFSMSPLERKMAGITQRHLASARKRGRVLVRPPQEKKIKPWWPKGEIAANPRSYRYNYTVPVYAFNQNTNTLAGLQDGITAGFRPQVLGKAVPVVGGLIANSILAGSLSKLAAQRFGLSDTVKGPVSIGIGLATAGALSYATKMFAPRYAQGVFLGGISQVLWDTYKTYLQPIMQNRFGIGCCPDLTFGLWCPECAQGLSDFLTPSQVQDAQSVISEAAAPMLPPVQVATAAPPLTARVNGKEVPVEKVQNGVGDFGDYLTPNEVSEAVPIG